MHLFIGALLACGFACVAAQYNSRDDVVELTVGNFNNEVIKGDEVWMVQFYAPWCGHCQRLATEWKKAATALKGVVKVGAVDMDNHGSVGGPYNIRGFPTILIFGANKNSPTVYNGDRTASGITKAGLKAAMVMVTDRLAGRTGSAGDTTDSDKTNGQAVVMLTDENFENEVLGSKDLWLVEFFAPWCGHCQQLAPEFAKAATELEGKVKLGAVDATVNTKVAAKFKVQGYPTLLVFPAGVKTWASAEDYDGGRTASDIVAWALARYARNIPPPDIVEITGGDKLKENCDDKALCVISFLPHLLDCGAKCRNDYLATLKMLGGKYKAKSWGWLWVPAGAQLELEKSLGIGSFGYPAMAIVSVKKKLFVKLKGPFTYEGIDEFLRSVAVGRERTEKLPGGALPEVDDIKPWDGKDEKLPKEDDMDLDDSDLDDLDHDDGGELK